MKNLNTIRLANNQRGQLPPLMLAVLLLLAVAGFLAYNSVFVVNQWQQAVVTQFGEIQGDPITEPGLKFIKPFVQEAVIFDKRLLRWNGNRTTAITRDRRNMEIDITARWKINDASKFLQRFRSVDVANNRLNGIIENAVRNVMASYDLHEIVRSSNMILGSNVTVSPVIEVQEGDTLEFLESITTLGRVLPKLEEVNGVVIRGRPTVLAEILQTARKDLEALDGGIEIADILIRQLSYTKDIEENVYSQMSAELGKISAGYRSLGNEKAEQKRGEMYRELATIRSEGERRAAEIRGEGEARAIRIYAEAYNQDKEFFRFIRTLNSYDKVIGSNSTLVLGTDSELYQILKNLQP
jgi:membrane protease subunit HflC